MTGESPYDGRSFNYEARERLTSLETRQETIQERTDELKEGQEEIAEKIDNLDFVDPGEFDEVAERAKKNEKARLRARTLIKLTTAVGTLGGSIGAVVVAL